MNRPPRTIPSLPVHAGDYPDPAEFRLVVDGLVDHRLELTATELGALPRAAVTDDFRCLEGWSVPDVHWEGVALSTVLEAASVRAGARWVQLSAGEFSVPLELAVARRALLATHVAEAILAPEHGGPARLVVPGGDCFTSIKWLNHVEVRTEPAENTGRRIALGRIAPKHT